MKAGRIGKDVRIGAVAAAMLLAFVTGCKEDARLADATIKSAVVTDVTDAGLTLDKNATPEMVTFVLLKAIKDDVEAKGDDKAREAAFDRQFRLAAPAAIHQQHIRWVGAKFAERDESVYKTARTWAPTLAHYVGSFGFSFDEAGAVMKTATVPPGSKENLCKTEEKHVFVQARDPGGDPNADVVVRVRLVQEDQRWRVWWVGFDRAHRHLAAKPPPVAPTSQPTS